MRMSMVDIYRDGTTGLHLPPREFYSPPPFLGHFPRPTYFKTGSRQFAANNNAFDLAGGCGVITRPDELIFHILTGITFSLYFVWAAARFRYDELRMRGGS